jgi:hypothetical protein
MKYIIFVFLCVLIIPTCTKAQIRINEIAWMGTSESQFGEWVELYNDGNTSVDLNGWKLFVDGGATLMFTFTKSISAGGYLVIERTTASTPDPLPGIQDESGSFGGGGLANTGEHIVLKDKEGVSIQSLNFASGWPAGDATTKQTMQWVSNAWGTASPTPKERNEPVIEDHESNESEAPSSPVQDEKKKDHPKPSFKPVVPHIVIDAPPHIHRGIESVFDAYVALVDAFEGDRYWTAGTFVFNMGNGDTRSIPGGIPLSYTYEYPGTYMVTVQYYRTALDTNPILFGTEQVEVLVPEVSIEPIDSGKAVKITNKTSVEINLSGWNINEKQIPQGTILAPKASIVISAKLLGLSSISATTSLDTPDMDSSALIPLIHEKDTRHPLEEIKAVVEDLVSTPVASAAVTSEPVEPKTKNRTKTIVIGAVLLFVISLYLLLERFMAQQE